MIVMSSNIGSNWIQEAANDQEMKKRVMESLGAHFRPEFLNRIDEILIFNRLNADQMNGIVEMQLRQLLKRLSEKQIQVLLTEPAKRFLVKEGFHPTFGARPLKRAIQKFVADPLAQKIVANEFMEGDTVEVSVSRKEGIESLTFKKAVSKTQALA
jgi:ATP-dependent Clp protease ATP-binding subunit ClpB